MFTRGPRLEVRIDPEDGVRRTLEEVKARYKGQFSEQAIQDYWDHDMLSQEGERVVNVVDDPFLTHGPRRGATAQADSSRAPSQLQSAPGMPTSTSVPPSDIATRYPLPPPPGELADVHDDPFLSGAQYRSGVGDPSKAPFFGHSMPDEPPSAASGFDFGARKESMAQAMSMARRHWTESFFRLLGPGDPLRDFQSRNVLMFGPLLVFVWLLLVWLVLRHFSVTVAFILTAAAGFSCVGMMLSWFQGRRSGPVSMLTLGFLGLAATVAATAAGVYGWEQYWRQYWWTQTGFRGGATSADTPAMARADYAVVDFWNDATGAPNNDTRVDHSRAAGYKDTDFYCVAPILSPGISGASLVRVNYWAVGINCCQRYGAFTCDDAREWDAGSGIVMLGEGYPCPGCNVDKFRAAVMKAEAVHGLVSVKGARFVRWVKDTGHVETRMLLQCITYVLFYVVLAGCCFAIVGWLAWYYAWFVDGIGEGPAKADSLLAATEVALQQRGFTVADTGYGYGAAGASAAGEGSAPIVTRRIPP